MEERFIENYYPVASKEKTFITLFERYDDRLNIEFKTWLTTTAFEQKRPPYQPHCFSFPIVGQTFNNIYTIYGQIIQDLDNRIRIIGKLDSLGVELDYYSINALDRVIVIKTKSSTGVFAPILTFTHSQFDAIVENEENKPDVAKALELAWGYGSNVSDYLASLISPEE
jgi:hypothetical protein